MAAFPNPITLENFPKAWRYVCRKYRSSKVKYAIRKFALPIGQLLFFPAFLLLSFGAAYSLTTAGVQALVGRVPVLPQLWLQLQEALFGSSQTVLEHVIRAAAFLYVVPFGAYLLAALIILLVYHPKTPGTTGDIFRDAQELWTTARHAQMHARVKEKDFSGTLALIAGILNALGSLAVVFYWLLVPGGEDVLAGIGVPRTLQLFGLALALIFSYGIIVLPLNLLMKLVHGCHIPARMVESAEIFCRGLRRAPASAPEVPAAVAAVPVAPQPQEVPEEKPAEAPTEAPAVPAEEPAPAE